MIKFLGSMYILNEGMLQLKANSVIMRIPHIKTRALAVINIYCNY